MRLNRQVFPWWIAVGLLGLGIAIAGLSALSVSAPANGVAARPANPLSDPNYLGTNSVAGPNGTRYFSEPGSSTITVLGAQGDVQQSWTATDASGAKVAIERLHFDKQRGQLMAISGPELYLVNPGGVLTPTPVPQGATRDRVYNRLERRQKEAGTAEERAAKGRAAEIVARGKRGEAVSVADKAFLETYNGPSALPAPPPVLPERVALPPDPAELARKAQAQLEPRVSPPPVTRTYEYEFHGPMRPAPRGGLDEIDGCPCPFEPFEVSANIPIDDDSDSDYCDPDTVTQFSFIFVGNFGVVTDVNLGVDITHTWVGDLVITLEHNGTVVHLKSHAPTGAGEGCDNLVTMFDDEGASWVENACPHSGCTQSTDPFGCGNNLLSAFDGMDIEGPWIIRVADVAELDVGTLNALSLCITPEVYPTLPECGCPEPGFGSGLVNLPIPDASGSDACDASGGIADTIVVPFGTAVITDVNVAVNLEHTWVGDLVIDLTHNGTTVRLLTHVPFGWGEGCDDLFTVFDDEGMNWIPGACPHSGCTRPYDPSDCGNHALAAFNGMSASGEWILRVVDQLGGDEGTLSDWSVCFNAPDPPVCEQCPAGVIDSGPLSLPIPDNTTADPCAPTGGISHTIMVPPGSGLVQDVNIGMNILHALVGDLMIEVIHEGVTVRLRSVDMLDEACADYFDMVFDDEGSPYPYPLVECLSSGCYQTANPALCASGGLLSAFDGYPAEGPWTLRVADGFPMVSGTLQDWHLCLDTEPVAGHVSVAVEFPDFSCAGGVLTPNPFTYTVHAWNDGGVACDNVLITLFAGAGPGGSATVEYPEAFIPTLAPGDTVDLNFAVTITPSGTGGCLAGAITVGSANCGAYVIDFFCLLDVPGCAGEEGNCGCMDVVLAVDVTGSMMGAIDNVASELPAIVAQANAASGGDLRLGLVTFDDLVHTLHSLTFNQAAVTATIAGLSVWGGAGEPEASDEALREIITQDALCTDGSEFGTDFRGSCAKVVVLITDARPGGCDDDFTAGVDDVNAHQRALDALGANVLLSAVYVPTWPDFAAQIIPVMQDYALTTGGSYVMTNSDGSGTGAAIGSIIENCGGGTLPDDCLPDGPNCNGQAPLIYTSLSGMIDNAVICVSGDSLRMDWQRVADAEFYQIYTGGMDDAPFNYRPVGVAFDTTFCFSPELLAAAPSQRVMSCYVQAKQAVENMVSANLACWPIDENGGDLTADFAQDNDGTIHGAEWITSVPGHAGLRFGYNDYVDVLNDVEFYGQPLQVDACVTIPSYPTIQTGAFYIFSCHRYATWFEGFGLRIDVNGRLLSEVWNHEDNGWNTLWAPPSKPVPLGVPFLVTAVINGDQSLLLLNGEVVAAGTQDYNSISNGFHMTIGAHNYNSDRYQYHMRGDIHWLRVAQHVNN